MCDENKRIVSRLEEWYDANARDLPWRRTQDAYKIWVSEIILQQTRVAQGYDYYLRFVNRFPDVESLATAQLDEVMKYWQGLGYYSRARNMYAAAQDIMERFGGVFPSTYDDIRSLKGVGDYTAAAIASIAFNEPYAVVDGNVYRVLSRLFDVDTPIDTPAGKRYFAQLASVLLHREQAGLYNQAIMEFGALQCTPAGCDCVVCPLQELCMAYASKNVERRPVKQGKVSMKSRFFNYLAISCGERIWLHKRAGRDIWCNLYEFPLIETDKKVDFIELQHLSAYQGLFSGAGCVTLLGAPFHCKHILTHRIIQATFYTIEVEHMPEALAGMQSTTYNDIEQYAVARLTELYLQHRVDTANSAEKKE